jgi:hypothetical protein
LTYLKKFTDACATIKKDYVKANERKQNQRCGFGTIVNTQTVVLMFLADPTKSQPKCQRGVCTGKVKECRPANTPVKNLLICVAVKYSHVCIQNLKTVSKHLLQFLSVGFWLAHLCHVDRVGLIKRMNVT